MFPLLASVVVGQAATVPAIIPIPATVLAQPGEFLLSPETRIVSDAESREVAESIRELLRPATGLPLTIGGAGGKGTISVDLDRRLSALGDEGYRLSVKADRVEIRAFRAAGAYYAAQTLRQLLPPSIFRAAKVEGQRWSMPCVQIEDKPRFPWRGALIDSSRHFLPKEGILRFLDTLAMHKLNVFHWHLTDDNGWRLEIKRFPKLTQIGAWQPETLPDYDPPKPKTGFRGGFYTEDDVREVVAYAKARNITVVPEIEMPGHSGAIVASYPELGVPNSNVLNAEEATVRVMEQILDEVMALFPSKFIHVGGDEVDKSHWQKDARTQELMKQRGLKDEHELQSWFIRQMDAYLTSKGRRLLGWDEILEGGLAPGATVMSWRGIDGGIAAAKAGHDVVMSPTSHLYLDYYQAEPASEPVAIGGYLPIETVYSYEPVPTALNADQAKHVLGIQGQLWTEFIPNIKHLEYMAWPRLAAVSEVAWSHSRNLNDFVSRLTVGLKRFDALGVKYRPMSGAPINRLGEWRSHDTSSEWTVREWDATAAVQGAGQYTARFAYTHGASRILVKWAELLLNGQVVARDEHEGYAGWWVDKNTYLLPVTQVEKGAKYTLRAEVRADGTDSNGTVYLVGPEEKE